MFSECLCFAHNTLAKWNFRLKKKKKREQSCKPFKPAKTWSEQRKAFQDPFGLGPSCFTSGIMLSPGSFAAVQVDFLCTSDMSPELPSPQTSPCGPRVSLWAYRKEIHQNLKNTQNRSSLGFFFWLSLPNHPPLFFFLTRKRYCQQKHFPHLHSCHTTWQPSHSHLSY